MDTWDNEGGSRQEGRAALKREAAVGFDPCRSPPYLEYTSSRLDGSLNPGHTWLGGSPGALLNRMYDRAI